MEGSTASFSCRSARHQTLQERRPFSSSKRHLPHNGLPSCTGCTVCLSIPCVGQARCMTTSDCNEIRCHAGRTFCASMTRSRSPRSSCRWIVHLAASGGVWTTSREEAERAVRRSRWQAFLKYKKIHPVGYAHRDFTDQFGFL